MNENSYVVVFPSIFSENKTALLAENIKKILKIRQEEFSSLKKDGSIIIVDANDPVFASSAINLLFGIKRVSIAKQIRNNFEEIVTTITEIGSNLLLRGDRFLVRVEGESKGFLPKDVEIASTSSIIEKNTTINVKPGTQEDYDKLLYTFLTKSNAYVCIFLDEGLGGVPYGSQKEKIVCCIFDELSAISCLETIKQGFEVKIIVCYNKVSQLTDIVKMLNQIIPRMISLNVELEFFRIDKSITKEYLEFLRVAIDLSNYLAKKYKITHVSLPLSSLIHTIKLIDEFMSSTFRQGLIPILAMNGLDDNVFKTAKEIGLEKHLSRIEKLVKRKNRSMKLPSSIKNDVLRSINTSGQKIIVQLGPNNVHDILDSLQLVNYHDNKNKKIK